MAILQCNKSQVLGTTFASKVQISHGEHLLFTTSCYLEMKLKFGDKIQFYAQFYNFKCRIRSTKKWRRIECRIEM